MSKKVLSVILAITFVVALLCVGAFTASADEAVHTGDQVKYIFSVAPLSDVGGLTVNSTYDASVLTYVSSDYVYSEGMGAVNDFNAGAVNWNDTFAQGLETNNTDIFAITFNGTAYGDVSSRGLSSNCIELFDVNAIDIPGDFNSLVTARVEVIHNHESDTESSNTETETEKDTTTEKDATTDTEKYTDTNTDVSSATSSSASSNVSSNTSSSKKDTPDTSKPTSSSITSSSNTSSKVTSGSSSTTNSSSKPATSSNSSKNNSSSVATVKTAGTVAIISLVIVLMAAAAIVFFSKKNSVN